MNKTQSNGFIRYQKRPNRPHTYAVYCKATRNGNYKTNNDEYLGKVIDKELGIFHNNKRGFFGFNVTDGYSDLPQNELEYQQLICKKNNFEKLPNYTLDFGDVYLLHEILKSSGLLQIFEKAFPDDIDTLLTLIYFKLLDNEANSYAADWYESSYIRYLFPKASIQLQRISEFLDLLGYEGNLRNFFSAYHSFLTANNKQHGILIDSTGLPNAIDFNLSAINNHNGVINREVRLILVNDKVSGFPLYFRYIPGNIVDVTTLIQTLDELREYNINIDESIMDAGYFSEGNIKELYENHINFIIRLSINRNLYKELTTQNVEDLKLAKYLTKYRERVISIKCVETNLFGYTGYAYVAVDQNRRFDEQKHYMEQVLDEKTPPDHQTIDENLNKKGMFVILSSIKYEPKDILPLYYTRQAIEQVFDYAKNDLSLTPVRVHGVKTFRGHLLISFMASIALIFLNQKLHKSGFSARNAIYICRTLKINIFNNVLIPSYKTKNVNKIFNSLNIAIPRRIDC